MTSIFDDLRSAQKLYEDAGVDGSEGARMMKVAADRIERLEELLSRYRNETPLGYQPHMIAGEVDELLNKDEAPK